MNNLKYQLTFFLTLILLGFSLKESFITTYCLFYFQKVLFLSLPLFLYIHIYIFFYTHTYMQTYTHTHTYIHSIAYFWIVCQMSGEHSCHFTARLKFKRYIWWWFLSRNEHLRHCGTFNKYRLPDLTLNLLYQNIQSYGLSVCVFSLASPGYNQ